MEKTLKVLDHGEVTLVDVFGNDTRIADVARGSYKLGTKRTSSDEQLIRYLIRHQHSSPIEFGQLIFHMKMPIFVARQLVRHRTIKMNEASLRYSEAPEEMYVPNVQQCTAQSTTNKQGRVEYTDDAVFNATLSRDRIIESGKYLRSKYEELLSYGTAREIARIVLPLSQYTEMSVSWDLRNLLGFLKLRQDPHAQWEIRVYANAIHDLARPYFPIVFAAYDDYIRNARTLSSLEQRLLFSMTDIQHDTPSESYATQLGMSKREYTEFYDWLTEQRKSN